MIKNILCINGSSRPDQHNARLIQAMIEQFTFVNMTSYLNLEELPLYRADYCAQRPAVVSSFSSAVSSADAIVICTPEYIHGIPAVLKNALEWLTDSGELYNKPCLLISYTPHAPRGKHAMSSLRQSMIALHAQIITELSLYQNELLITADHTMSGNESIELLTAATELLS